MNFFNKYSQISTVMQAITRCVIVGIAALCLVVISFTVIKKPNVYEISKLFQAKLNKYLQNKEKYENGYGRMDDPGLIQHIKDYWLIHPKASGKTMQSSEEEKDYSQIGQSKFIDNLFNKKKHGFFIECGAADGVHLSNTLFFEKFRGWSGLLVEPDPEFFQNIVKKRSRSYAVNSCLSVKNETDRVSFVMEKFLGKIAERTDKESKKKFTIIQCFPLFSLLEAIGVKSIDYFSLDIEGAELDVLKTIPWNKVKIKVLDIEYRAYPEPRSKSVEKLEKIRAYMRDLNIYDEVGLLPTSAKTGRQGLDVVFILKNF
jgi:FkbM family methyltransferase